VTWRPSWRREAAAAADPAGPDHHDVLGADGGGGQGVGVMAAAQIVDAVQVRPGHREAARGGPGGQQQPVVADPLAGGELDVAAGRVDRADRGGAAQLDVVGGVEALVVQVEAVAVGLAAQVGLGQGRAVVRPLVLVAEQQQAAVEAFGAQGLGRLGAGQAGPDDGEGGRGGHGELPWLSLWFRWPRR
jgi:hypothetical protein